MGGPRAAARAGARRAARVPARRVVCGSGQWQAGGVIVGIGVDIVDIARLQTALRRTPSLASRLFTDGERGRGPASLAACFAAKEAAAKALGAPAGLRWADVEVTHDGAGRPALAASGTVAEEAARRGVLRWHLSITHDGGVSVAMVVAEA
ncbi:MAG TPA: holo-ACP synthase [Streptosporangiaceae bacterium]|nr:holo-ACP synthase [Streptosporangiaceae bacterium]